MVRRAARPALEAGLAPVIVVLGFEAERVAAAIEGLPVETALNQRHAEGIHTSVQAGLDRVGERTDAAIVILADMPLVTPLMLRELVARFRGGAPIVISRYGEIQAPPTLYARSLFPALSTGGEGCGRRVIREHSDLVTALDWSPELLADLDRPEDIARVRALVTESG